MAVEQKWLAVPPRLFASDGTQYGIVTVATTAGFKVKQRVIVCALALPDLTLQCKRVISPTQLIVGPMPNQQAKQSLSVRTDISAYTVALGAYIYAEEQDKSRLKAEDIWQAVYEQEPTVAVRTTWVDQWGDFFGPGNPVPVIFDGTIEVGQVEIVDPDGDILLVNDDGSINVNIVQSPVTGHSVKSIYNQILSVVSGATTTLINYTVPAGTTAVLERANASGENVARYDILLNNVLFDTRRTMFGADLTTDFDYTSGNNDGIQLVAGDNIKIQVLHNRPMIGDFNARLQVLEIV